MYIFQNTCLSSKSLISSVQQEALDKVDAVKLEVVSSDSVTENSSAGAFEIYDDNICNSDHL